MPPPVLAVAHGSSDPGAAAVTAAIFASSGLSGRVAYLDHGGPRPAEVLAEYAAAGERTVVVLPLLLSHAGHAVHDIATLSHPGLELVFGRALGPHPLLAAVLRDRLAACGAPPSASVLVAAAGTRDAAANAAVAALAVSLGGSSGGFAATACGFASLAAPTVAAAAAGLRAAAPVRTRDAGDGGVPGGGLALAPYFLAWGRLPRAAVEAAAPDWVAEPLGPDPRLGEVLAQRYADALG